MKIPGLVDLQVNGYKGVDFSDIDVSESSLAEGFRSIINSGTTAFLATVITGPEKLYRRNLPLIAKVVGREEFRGHVLGIHVEGPFISPAEGARGAHTLKWIRKPDVGFLKEIIELGRGHVRLLTIAAEVEGAEELTRYAVSRGITVGLGHQMATAEDLRRQVQAGARVLTHLGNGLPSMVNRHENPLLAGLGNDELSAIMITDGHHLPEFLVKTIIRTKGTKRCIVVTDSTSLAGMKPGEYESLGADVVLESNGRLYIPATGYLAGSAATMMDCMNWLASLKLVKPQELIDIGFYNPLRLIGVSPEKVGEGKIYFDREKAGFCIEN